MEDNVGTIKTIGSDMVAKPQGTIEAKFMVIIKEDEIKQLNTPIVILVKSDNKLIEKIKTSFLGKIETFRKNRKK